MIASRSGAADNLRMLPTYIEYRIRRSPPPGCCIVAGSTPVVSFGNAQTATVATLGLNPSRVEFLDRDGSELVGDLRRLATHSSLGTADLSTAPAETIKQVLADCNDYFQRRPYRRWFDQFQPILNACGSSFYDGTACHLDLVQWATDPTWGKLQPASTRKQLLADDAAFLADQLQNESLRLLLVNGMSVLRQLRRTIPIQLEAAEPIIGYAHVDCGLFAGTILKRVRVVAWTTNLQSSFGVTSELRGELALQVGRLAGKLC
jgi:hypothetical protein